MKTLQEAKRQNVRSLFKGVLKEDFFFLRPGSLVVKETSRNEPTCVKFSFFQPTVKEVFLESSGSGFVDVIFSECQNYFSDRYSSLNNLTLLDYKVSPDFAGAEKETGSDAHAAVFLVVGVRGYGTTDFSRKTRSILYSSFSAILSVFQFYINCEKSFDKLSLVVKDAGSRNRSDIRTRAEFQMSVLTGVNSYVPKC